MSQYTHSRTRHRSTHRLSHTATRPTLHLKLPTLNNSRKSSSDMRKFLDFKVILRSYEAPPYAPPQGNSYAPPSNPPPGDIQSPVCTSSPPLRMMLISHRPKHTRVKVATNVLDTDVARRLYSISMCKDELMTDANMYKSNRSNH